MKIFQFIFYNYLPKRESETKDKNNKTNENGKTWCISGHVNKWDKGDLIRIARRYFALLCRTVPRKRIESNQVKLVQTWLTSRFEFIANKQQAILKSDFIWCFEYRYNRGRTFHLDSCSKIQVSVNKHLDRKCPNITKIICRDSLDKKFFSLTRDRRMRHEKWSTLWRAKLLWECCTTCNISQFYSPWPCAVRNILLRAPYIQKFQCMLTYCPLGFPTL